jgi:hypothetical protein
MPTKVNSLTPLTTPAPNRSMSASVFAPAAQNFANEITALVPALNLRIAEMNSAANELTAQAGAAMAYTFDTATADADPGNGLLRLSAATQNTATVIRMDLLDSAGSDLTALLTSFGTSASAIKGALRVAHRDTPTTKFITFNVTAVASPAGYRNVTATPVAFSSANPFVNGDPLTVVFSRTGDGGGIAPADYQNQSYISGTTAGTATAYTFAPAAAIAGYAANQSFFVTFHAASGTSPTIQISGVATPPNLVKQLGDGTFANIAAGDIPINHRARVTMLSATQAWVEELPIVQGKARTFSNYASGSGTWTRPAGCIAIRVRMIGGGGGGAGSATVTGSNGASGGSTTFGTNIAVGGNGGIFGTDPNVNGASTTTLGTLVLAVGGGLGGNTGASNVSGVASPGGTGGSGPFGGGGGGALYTHVGYAGVPNTGGGGGGGGGPGPGFGGAGGNAGSYIELFVASPAATYTYAVGAGGTGGAAGAGGAIGGAGGSGLILVEEFY